MKIRNKVELKKSIIISFVVIVIFSILFIFLNVYEYNKYTNNYNKKINSIISEVLEKYPDVNKEKMISIINSSNEISEDLFYTYGIDMDKDSVILENDTEFKRICIIDSLVLVIFSLILLGIFLRYNSSKDKKLQEITKYIEEINNRNYKLDIEDNTEDELSILKNEIYKTTVMLKEVAENSKNDRVKLKDSLSDISHQLKTPLTSIVIMLDNILDNPQMEKNVRDEFLRDIKKEIININFLVASLLKLSKFDANSVDYINKEEKIIDIINKSIKNISILCDLKNINIMVNGYDSISIICDFNWQVEAITNILKNCVEHSNVNSNIDIYFEQNKTYSKIQIKDYGVGIYKEDLPHIFERFYRGRNSSTESVGIGLALAKSIIEKNNGYISVKSKIGEGTEFNIKYFRT